MEKRIVVLVSCMLAVRAMLPAQQEESQPRDTVYHFSPVIVTATQAKERQTPATYSNLTSRQLQERYSVQDVPVLLAELPSITTYSENGNGIGYNYINLRGFDQRRISVMINGVPQNDPEDHNVYWIDFPDLMASTDNIQIQRGAGSAFYGPPAIGGSVNLVTNPFQRDPGIELETAAGFQQFGDSSRSLALNTRKNSVMFTSGPVGDHYMFHGRLAQIHSDGYRTNSYVDLTSYFFGAIRFDKDMTTRLHFFGGPIEDGLAYYGLPKFVNGDTRLRRQNLNDWGTDPLTGKSYSYVVPRRPQEIENFSQPHYELLNDWRLADSVRLYNTLFYYAGDGFFDYDASWADTSMLRIGFGYGIPTSQNPANTLVRAFVGNRQWGWLPRIEIEHGRGTLTVGAELRIHRSTHWGKIQYAEGLPPGYDPDYHFYEYNGVRNIASVYGHELLRLGDDFILMMDLQLIRNTYGIRNEKYLGYNFTVPYFFANPRAGLQYNMDDQWSFYLSLGYTSREPVMRNLYAAEDSYFGATPQFQADTSGGRIRYDFDNPLAKPEHLLDLELGTHWSSPHARLSTSAYWMEFTDELVNSGQVDIFGQPVTGNAPRTRHIGLEVEGAWDAGAGLTVNGNVSLSRNRHVSYHYFTQDGRDSTLDGNPIAGFPDVLGNLRLTYRNERITASISGRYVGAFHTDNFKNEANTTDAYTLFNLELLYSVQKVLGVGLSLRGEVWNLFDTLYLASGEGSSFFPGAERSYVVGVTLNI